MDGAASPGCSASQDSRDHIGRHLPRAAALFSRVRARLRLRWALRAVEWALFTALACGVVWVALDRLFAFSPEARCGGLVALAALSGIVLLCELARSTAGRIGPLYLASRVEAVSPDFAGRLIAAVEFASTGAPPEGSSALLYEQADELARGVDPAEVVDAEIRRTRVHGLFLGAVALALVTALVMGDGFRRHATRCLLPWLQSPEPPPAFALIKQTADGVREDEGFSVEAVTTGERPKQVTLELALEGGVERRVPMSGGRDARAVNAGSGGVSWTADVEPIESSGTFRLRAEFASVTEPLLTGEHPITLVKTPRACDVRVTYFYPDYAKLPPRTQAGGAVDALIGTRVEIEFSANTTLARASLLVKGERPLKMEMSGRAGAGDATWSAGFTVRRSGSYRVELASAEGVEAATQTYPVVARTDSAPTCNVVHEPRPTEEALARGATFRVSASDDLGLEELVLVVRRGEGAAAFARASRGGVFNIPVPGFERGRREADVRVTIPPQVMPLEPGVTYTYYVRAADGRPPEPHLVTSTMRTFRIDRPKDDDSLLAARRRKKKKRPPLLEPPDDRRAGGSSRGDGSGTQGGDPPPSSRGLASLQDPPSGGSPPPRGGKGSRPAERSRYANESGLEAEESEGKQAKSEGAAGGQGGEGGAPEINGQGKLGGGSKQASSKGGGPGSTGSGAGGSGDSRTANAGGPGASGSPGGPRPRETPEGSDGGARPGGGGYNTGLPDSVPTDRGVKSGDETGESVARPETVDDEAVADLDVTPEEAARARVPGRPDGGGGTSARETGRITDVAPGRRREVGRMSARVETVSIPQDKLPSAAITRSRPVGRAYRALVAEYFRRLQELSSDD